jgi:hypothetical protein
MCRWRLHAVTAMSDTVLPFPTPEERARRLQIEVERIAQLSMIERMYLVSLDGYAERFGTDSATLKKMIDAVVQETEKKKKTEQAEQRRAEDHAEKQRDRTALREQREQKQREDAAEKAAKKAEKREREKHEAFASGDSRGRALGEEFMNRRMTFLLAAR